MSRAHVLVDDARQPGVNPGAGVKSLAARAVRAGEVVFQEGGELSPGPGMHTIQIGISVHMQVPGDGRWTAHSFEPNCRVRIVDFETAPIDFVAIRDIAEGEALSIDYTATEWEMAGGGFVCEASGREVRGFKHRSESERRQLFLDGLLPEHTLRLWMAEKLGCSAGTEYHRGFGSGLPP